MSAIVPEVIDNPKPLVTTSRIAAFYGGLTSRQDAFIGHYLQTGNGTQSAKLAGYQGDENTLAVAANQLLRTSKIQLEIKRRLGTSIASSSEVLETLSKHARADITDVLDSDGSFNLKRAKRQRILKKLKVKTRYEKDSKGNLTPITEHEYEIHDPQSALDKLGKFHGLWDKQPENNLDSPAIAHELFTLLRQAAEQARAQQNATPNELNPASIDT